MKTVYNILLTTLYMAKFKITPTTTVAGLKEQFRNEVGCVLRVYQGRSEAPDGATLVSLGAKEGELECRMENPGGGDHVTRVRLTPWPFLGLTIDN